MHIRGILQVQTRFPNQKSVILYYTKNDSISSIKKNLQLQTGISESSQIISYNGLPLSDAICVGKIEPYVKILKVTLDIAVKGGAQNLEPFDAPDMTSEACFELQGFSASAPIYRVISEGINFEGICRKYSCIAYKRKVWVNLGMCEESNKVCNYAEYMFELQCPACEAFIFPNDITNVSFYRCSVKIKFKKIKSSFTQYEMVAPADNCLCLKNAEEILKYNYIKFTLS